MDNYMNEAQHKAEVLVEALPYIQQFNRKIIVVKYGGSAMNSEELKRSVIKDVTLLKLVGFKPIIVHGGGKEISRWVAKTGKEAQFVNGLRVTDDETMEIAEMVLGRVSKQLVTMVGELGVKAVSVSGKDGGLIRVKKKYADGQDIGYVGEITSVEPKILYDLLENDYLPIVAPIGLDDNFATYNINYFIDMRANLELLCISHIHKQIRLDIEDTVATRNLQLRTVLKGNDHKFIDAFNFLNPDWIFSR